MSDDYDPIEDEPDPGIDEETGEMFDEDEPVPQDGIELSPADKRSLRQMESRMRFIELRAKGLPELTAAYEIGWSPAELRFAMRDREFAAAVADAEQMRDEHAEMALYQLAVGLPVSDGEGGTAYIASPNFQALQWWLVNRVPDRWKDVKRMETTVSTTVAVAVLEVTRDTVLEALRTGGSVAALQQQIIDAEVIEDGEDA